MCAEPFDLGSIVLSPERIEAPSQFPCWHAPAACCPSALTIRGAFAAWRTARRGACRAEL